VRRRRILLRAGDELTDLAILRVVARGAPGRAKAETGADAGPAAPQAPPLSPMNGSIRQCNDLFDLICSTVLLNKSTRSGTAAAGLVTTLGHPMGPQPAVRVERFVGRRAG
jgi:hypothetical protein